jgi:hypothetical protein
MIIDAGTLLACAVTEDPVSMADMRGLGDKAYPNYLPSDALYRVANFIAGYRPMWDDMPELSRAEHLGPRHYLQRLKLFQDRWAARVRGRDPKLSSEQCWDRMQDEFAGKIRQAEYERM